MDAVIKWNGEGMSFEGVGPRDYPVTMGAGEKKGASPIELLLLSLGGCTGMDCIMVMLKKRQDVRSFRIEIHAERVATYPQKYTKIEMEYIFEGHDLDRLKVEKAVDISSNKYCSVKASLDPAIEFITTITINEID